MSSSNLKILLTEYDKKRTQAEFDADERKSELYKKEPRLQEIDDEISKAAINISMKMLSTKDTTLLEELNNKINSLKKEKENILISLGKDLNYLKPCFECSDCEDTGYIRKNNETVMCHCLKQKLFNLEYNNSNISNLAYENFEHFSFDLYSDEIDEDKYHSKFSPRKNMEFIYKLSNNFIENFDSSKQKNLLFTGNTGLGKSFLSSCIANELLKKGKTVLYQTSSNMLDTIIVSDFDGTVTVGDSLYQFFEGNCFKTSSA